jgi:hypothetical protein
MLPTAEGEHGAIRDRGCDRPPVARLGHPTVTLPAVDLHRRTSAAWSAPGSPIGGDGARPWSGRSGWRGPAPQRPCGTWWSTDAEPAEALARPGRGTPPILPGRGLLPRARQVPSSRVAAAGDPIRTSSSTTRRWPSRSESGVPAGAEAVERTEPVVGSSRVRRSERETVGTMPSPSRVHLSSGLASIAPPPVRGSGRPGGEVGDRRAPEGIRVAARGQQQVIDLGREPGDEGPSRRGRPRNASDSGWRRW